LLVLKPDAVGETQKIDKFFAWESASICRPDFDLKLIHAIYSRGAGNSRIEISIDFFPESRKNLFFAYRRQAVGGRAHDFDAIDRLKEPFGFVHDNGMRIGAGFEIGRLADLCCNVPGR
jgi:hypothetical protein